MLLTTKPKLELLVNGITMYFNRSNHVQLGKVGGRFYIEKNIEIFFVNIGVEDQPFRVF